MTRIDSQYSQRGRVILHALVTEFIRSGAPVASGTLRQRGVALSPASIRHVLAELEEQGLLEQPHTSAGRVPTERGLRAFVDGLIEPEALSPERRAEILVQLHHVQSRREDLRNRDDVMRAVGRLLSSLSGAAAVLVAPRPEQDPLSQLRFMPLGPDRLLAVLATRTGNVENRVVRLVEPLSSAELERIHNLLDTYTEGRTLAELREVTARALANERGMFRKLHERLAWLLSCAIGEDGPPSVVIEGEQQLYDRPEFTDVEQLRSVLRVFGDRERLLHVLDSTIAAERIQVLIGSEVPLGTAQSLSLIAAGYGHGTGLSGTVGILGPMRMDYARLIPLVAFTAGTVSSLLDRDVT